MSGEQHHCLHQRFDDKAVTRVRGVGKTHRVTQLRHTMLNLNTRIHFHEKVLVAINDTFKGRHRIEANRLAESGCLIFHRIKRLHVLSKHCSLSLSPRLLCARLCGQQRFSGNRHLEKLLLMHLQRAITPAKRDAPLTVADHLNFLVPGCFDIQFYQHIFVIADTGGLNFVEYFPHQFRGHGSLA